jgi:hypothetical protein
VKNANEEARRGFSFFLLVGQLDGLEGLTDIYSTSPRMDVERSNSENLTRQVSPTTIHAIPSLLLFQSRCLNRDAIRAQSDSSSWILITCRLVSIVSGYLCPGHTGTLSVVLLKYAGKHAHEKSTCSSTYPLIQDSTSVCSLDTQCLS